MLRQAQHERSLEIATNGHNKVHLERSIKRKAHPLMFPVHTELVEGGAGGGGEL